MKCFGKDLKKWVEKTNPLGGKLNSIFSRILPPKVKKTCGPIATTRVSKDAGKQSRWGHDSVFFLWRPLKGRFGRFPVKNGLFLPNSQTALFEVPEISPFYIFWPCCLLQKDAPFPGALRNGLRFSFEAV